MRAAKDWSNYLDLLLIPDQFEQLGVLVSQRVIPDHMARSVLQCALVGEWEKWEPAIKGMRNADGEPGLYRNFEVLAKKWAAPE